MDKRRAGEIVTPCGKKPRSLQRERKKKKLIGGMWSLSPKVGGSYQVNSKRGRSDL